jgi:hypothetical protein
MSKHTSTLPKSGQVYRVPRRGKPARHVRLTRVRGLKGPQPKAAYIEVTRSGRKKGKITNLTWLQWDATRKKWSVPPHWVLCS